MPIRNWRPVALLLAGTSIFHGSIDKQAFLAGRKVVIMTRLLLVNGQKMGDMKCDMSTRHIMCYTIIFLLSHFL